MMSRTSFPQTQPMRTSLPGREVELAGSTSASLPPLLRRAPWQLNQTDGLVVLHGHPTVLRLGLWATADRSLAGESVWYVDGANVVDSFAIDQLSRAAALRPRTIPSSIHVSRALTCYQMVQLVTERVGPALRTFRNRAIVLSGPLEPFYDEAVSAAEAVRLAQVLFTSLRLLAGQGCPILCLCPPPLLQRRTHLLEALQQKADRVIEAMEDGEGLLLRERRAGILSSWRVPHAMPVCL